MSNGSEKLDVALLVLASEKLAKYESVKADPIEVSKLENEPSQLTLGLIPSILTVYKIPSTTLAFSSSFRKNITIIEPKINDLIVHMVKIGSGMDIENKFKRMLAIIGKIGRQIRSRIDPEQPFIHLIGNRGIFHSHEGTDRIAKNLTEMSQCDISIKQEIAKQIRSKGRDLIKNQIDQTNCDDLYLYVATYNKIIGDTIIQPLIDLSAIYDVPASNFLFSK
jgi:hypothetical protein